MSRTLLLGVLGVGAFATAFGLVKLLQRQSTPPGMVWISGGEFTMGSDAADARADEKPRHRVRVDGFWMDETEDSYCSGYRPSARMKTDPLTGLSHTGFRCLVTPGMRHSDAAKSHGQFGPVAN